MTTTTPAPMATTDQNSTSTTGRALATETTNGATAHEDNRTRPFPVRRAAMIAGVSYVVLFALGVFANFFVREGLIVSGDPAATAANIADSEGLFRAGMLAFLVIFILDVVVAWALHVVFRETNRDVSLLAAWFRIVYTVFLGVAVIFFFQALQLLNGTNGLEAMATDQLQAQALVSLETFNSTWLIGLVGFGLHLMVLGWLLIRSGYGPKLLGLVLVVAGGAYVVDTVAHTMLADYTDYAATFTAMVAVPAVLAEGWFGLWLILKAGRSEATTR